MDFASRLARTVVFAAALALAVQAADRALADEPGPLAAPSDKLDYLLRSWRGHSIDELKSVWGKPADIEPHGDRKVYVFERRVKVRPGIFGVSVYPNGGLRCVARFDADAAGKILRTSRQGGGQDCWNQFRKLEPR